MKSKIKTKEKNGAKINGLKSLFSMSTVLDADDKFPPNLVPYLKTLDPFNHKSSNYTGRYCITKRI